VHDCAGAPGSVVLAANYRSRLEPDAGLGRLPFPRVNARRVFMSW